MIIEIGYEVEDQVVVQSLERHLMNLIDCDNDPHETFDNKARVIAAFTEVLYYYTGPQRYDEIISEMTEVY